MAAVALAAGVAAFVVVAVVLLAGAGVGDSVVGVGLGDASGEGVATEVGVAAGESWLVARCSDDCRGLAVRLLSAAR